MTALVTVEHPTGTFDAAVDLAMAAASRWSSGPGSSARPAS